MASAPSHEKGSVSHVSTAGREGSEHVTGRVLLDHRAIAPSRHRARSSSRAAAEGLEAGAELALEGLDESPRPGGPEGLEPFGRRVLRPPGLSLRAEDLSLREVLTKGLRSCLRS